MLEIEVKSISRRFYGNIVTVGGPRHDIVINDSKTSSPSLIFHLNKKGLFANNLTRDSLHNEKRFTGKKMLEKKDVLTVSGIHMTVKDFMFETTTLDKHTIEELKKTAFLENPSLESLLNVLSKELVELEKTP